MERTSSTTGAMSLPPPLPISTGTTTSSARPSLAGIGPTTLPPTWSRPAKRSAAAGTPRRAARGAGRRGAFRRPRRRVVLLGAVELAGERPGDRDHGDPDGEDRPLAPPPTNEPRD